MTAPAATPREDGKRPRLFALLKVAFAALLLFLVTQVVPWSDRVLLVGEAGEVEVWGAIEGSWREESVAFVPAEESRAEALEDGVVLPGGRLELRRGDTPAWAGGREVDWRPGLPRVFGGLDGRGPALACLALIGGMLFAMTRWWRLLALAGCPTSWFAACRLSLIGQFFSVVMPGVTGGDLVKVVLAVRGHPERRAHAAISVVVDRLLGMVALLGLAAVVVLLSGERFAELRLPTALAVGAALFGTWVLLSPRSRTLPGVAWIIARLPQRERLDKLDEALQLYARHPFELALGLVLSLGNHGCAVLAAFAIGRGFGDDLPLVAYAGIVPIANAASSAPITPAGWGVGEAVTGTLFALAGSAATLGIAVSVTYRLCNIALWLVGGVFLLLPGGRDVGGVLRAAQSEQGTD